MLGGPKQRGHALQELGRRHVGYGVLPRHYATVGDALLWTLKRGLGQDFGHRAPVRAPFFALSCAWGLSPVPLLEKDAFYASSPR